jgi:hypothetical protein
MLKTFGIVLLIWLLANAAIAVGAVIFVLVEYALSEGPL